MTTIGAVDSDQGTSPPRAALVLGALILVAGVANINLSVANVALPDIGKALDASSTQLNLIAVGYSLGLAASVLYFGVLGDRFGRRRLLIAGMLLTLPASLIAGFAVGPNVLFAARVLGGISAGLAYPTTLAIITALWTGARRTGAIAAWSAIGAAISATGPVVSGALLEQFAWQSVFLVTLPLAVLALAGAWFLVPPDRGDTAVAVDNLGGVLSIVLVGATVLAINFAPLSNMRTAVWVLAAIAMVSIVVFVWRQLRIRVPLYDFRIASRPTFWVAAVGGIVIFGTLMGAMFVGQQYLQNVLGYSTLASGAMALPAAAAMVVVAPQSAKLVESIGSRYTLLIGYLFIILGLALALIMWHDTAPIWSVIGTYILIGAGVGFAGTPASHSLTGSVPVSRAGMASSTSDLQRDLGGAIMQSVLGAILTAGYAKTLTAAISASPDADHVSSETQAVLTKSFASAADLAQRYPQYSHEIITAARDAFVHGDARANAAAIVIVGCGALLVAVCYPKAAKEREAMRRYATERGVSASDDT
ncbi:MULTISPECIES: MFS transporter [unclassified Gordonia (in: high G+C Gram-positive bacteria)]|uniref:MFS transporter n=1 Tax=unclassified Gordonia (in: high G+C Gram-positive bacteria) TaxID=2657482 RepID=UPI0009AC82A6|nr:MULTISPECIES: MFS transporter [unclassified Gordonia (in: high G+C Gram-positive bacteria)]MDF3281085.1 MFS transporter [Gordonia sp. N1V]OPX14966.1 MFS transporter [Gordonia sp. i37]